MKKVSRGWIKVTKRSFYKQMSPQESNEKF